MGEEFVMRREKTFEKEWEKPEFHDFMKISLTTEAGWEDIPVAVARQFEGERIRSKDMYCELGGPKIEYKGELVSIVEPEEIEDQKVELIGPDVEEMEQGKAYPIGIDIKIAGKKVPKGAVEINFGMRVHSWTNFISGMMHMNGRDDTWMRIAKGAVEKGMNLKKWATVLVRLYKSEFPKVEKAQATIMTEPEPVKDFVLKLRKFYKEKEEEEAAMKEEETKPWYSCTLCQSFASANVCIITPERPASCGAINWPDAKAGYEMEPTGAWQPFDPGECLEPIKGEWSGANKEVEYRSGGINRRYYLHSLFGYPHTSCGCFESVSFYIPEVDGIGIVDRKFTKPTVNKLPFSTMAARTGGGMQTEGLLGTSKAYMKSKKFWYADGGWYRVVWLPSRLKGEVKDYIPEEMRDKIATEEDVANIDELKKFLREKEHPVVNGVVTSDGRKVTDGWKPELTKEDLLEYIEEHGGEIDIGECAEEFGVTEDDVNDLLEELVDEGTLEM